MGRKEEHCKNGGGSAAVYGETAGARHYVRWGQLPRWRFGLLKCAVREPAQSAGNEKGNPQCLE